MSSTDKFSTWLIALIAIIEATLKKFKHLLLFVSLIAVLSACNFPGMSSSPTQITDRNPLGPVATMILHVNPTPTKMITITPASPAPLEIASTPIPPNTPVWLAYDYTCALATGGGTMTMSLTWNDRSSSEEGYKVYRDEKVVATLPPNSTFYVDIAYVAAGRTLRYSVEAFNTEWELSTSTITHGCQ